MSDVHYAEHVARKLPTLMLPSLSVCQACRKVGLPLNIVEMALRPGCQMTLVISRLLVMLTTDELTALSVLEAVYS